MEPTGHQSQVTMLQAEADRLVTVAVYDQPHEAHLARLRLESEGIECRLHGEHMGGLAWPPARGVHLRVRRWQEPAARRVLLDCEPRESSADWITGDLEAPRCPRCGSLRVRPPLGRTRTSAADVRRRRGGWLAQLATLLFPRRRAGCRHCGHRWTPA